MLWARVQILAEETVPPLTHAYPLPRPVRAWALRSSSSSLRSASCTFTYWPSSIWRQFDPSLLAQRAQAVLRSVAAWEGVTGATGLGLVELAHADEPTNQQEHQPATEPTAMDAVAFSFRLSANLPLDDEVRQRLLASDTVVDRCVEIDDSCHPHLLCVVTQYNPIDSSLSLITHTNIMGHLGCASSWLF